MAKFSFLRSFLVMFALVASAPGVATAQEISEAHLAAAVAAVKASATTSVFDTLLPLLSEQAQKRLIQLRPELHKEIGATVEKVAASMANRRAELDNDVARLWAGMFTEKELKELTAFYESETGKKLTSIGQTVVARSMQAARSWSDRIGEEMLEKSKAELKNQGIDF